VRKPLAFLFDEPLSNLDAKMRVQMRAEIKRLHQRLQTTMIYVTHDQTEAMTMGNRIVVMKDGHIQQVDSPTTLYDKPTNKFVAGFIGSPPMNFLDGKIVKKNGKLYFDEGVFQVKVIDDMAPRLTPYLEKDLIFGIRPEDIYDKLFVSDAPPENTIRAICEVVSPMGSEAFLHLNTGNNILIAKVGGHDLPEVNQDIDLVLDMSKVHFFDKEKENAII
jgi:multiple sugar transport system ATP-binding protein